MQTPDSGYRFTYMKNMASSYELLNLCWAQNQELKNQDSWNDFERIERNQ